MHPAERLLAASKEGRLSGTHLLLCVTSSIAAVEDVRLVREFLRNGAEVTVAMTEDATRIIHPDSLWFASGKKVILQLDGDVQHVSLCSSAEDSADAVLVAPCTANMISKLAMGICDDAVSTMLVTALGAGKPVLLAPSMHGAMWANKIIQENIEKLVDLGVELIPPSMDEGKAKMADIETIVLSAGRSMLGHPLKGKKVVVIGGSTAEPIDSIRSITNISTGGTATSLAKDAYLLGADVELLIGQCNMPSPKVFKTQRFKTVAELKKLVSGKKYSIALVPAAISDFTVDKPVKGKVPSDKESLTIVLRRTSKIVDSIRADSIIGFKLEAGVKVEELKERAITRLRSSKMRAIVANRLEDITPDHSKVYLLDRSGKAIELSGSREKIARGILDYLLRVVK
jgi:phosphopantothenoylcysteine decarboxylase/phosphopantothenate--cysteine ligase